MNEARIEEIIRVDHAGEHGATSIYKGTLDILNLLGDKETIPIIEEMAEGEKKHVREFNRLIKERSIRPTALLPIWKLAGYSLGALSAVYGKNAIMACTEAVEEVIDKHYSEQIDELDKSGQEESLLNSLKEFHADEVEHEMIAKKELDETSTALSIFKNLIKIGCKGAIKVSEKI
tara:strand:- start:1751 stop:2278 length:528 start_codon:yes stop_codon:yes gene_type:complete